MRSLTTLEHVEAVRAGKGWQAGSHLEEEGKGGENGTSNDTSGSHERLSSGVGLGSGGAGGGSSRDIDVVEARVGLPVVGNAQPALFRSIALIRTSTLQSCSWSDYLPMHVWRLKRCSCPSPGKETDNETSVCKSFFRKRLASIFVKFRLQQFYSTSLPVGGGDPI